MTTAIVGNWKSQDLVFKLLMLDFKRWDDRIGQLPFRGVQVAVPHNL